MRNFCGKEILIQAQKHGFGEYIKEATLLVQYHS